MSEAADAPGRGRVWAGRILSAVPVLLMLLSGVMKLKGGPEIEGFFVGKFGYPLQTLAPIGVLEIVCALTVAGFGPDMTPPTSSERISLPYRRP